MVFLWWCILVLILMGYGIRLYAAAENADEITTAGIITEMVSIAVNFFLLYTSYHYVHLP